MTTKLQNDSLAALGNETFEGLAFPVIKVRFAGPTDTRGARYIATVRDIRVVHSMDYAAGPTKSAMLAAKKAWGKYQTSLMRNLNDHPVVFVPGDLSDDSYAYTVVPAQFLADVSAEVDS